MEESDELTQWNRDKKNKERKTYHWQCFVFVF